MSTFSKLMIPCFVLIVIIYGLKKNVMIYDAFLEGAKEYFSFDYCHGLCYKHLFK